MKAQTLDPPGELRVERLDRLGRGVAVCGELEIICDGALPGERVRVHGYTQRRQLAVATEYTISQRSEARIESLCRYFNDCGGCQLQHARYDAQLAYKESQLQHALLHYGAVSPQQWLPALSDSPYHYRRRVRLSVRCLSNDEIIIGFHRKHHSYLIDIQACPILDPRLHMLLVPLHHLVSQLSIRTRLPQIEMSAGELEVAVVFRHLQALSKNDRDLLRDFAEQHAVLVFTQAAGPDSVQPLRTDQATSLQYSFVQHQVRLTFAPTDFVQANAVINLRLVDLVMQLLDVQDTDTVLDLFCGIGNFSLPLARYVKKVIGVEGHPALVARAQYNAEHNGLRNLAFVQADLTHGVPQVNYNKLLLDPPREGAIDVIKHLAAAALPRIVYVSCNPKTLARDARYLVHHCGYRLRMAGLVDMFPQTKHIEAITLFEQ